MMLKLEALSPAEGIGIVRFGEGLRLVRPPYTHADSPLLREESLLDAILRYGYFASHEEFSNWAALVDFLNQKAVESRRALGKEIPDSIAAREILEMAPVDVLNRFLNRVENELIPHRSFDHAEAFLLALLTSGVMSRSPALRDQGGRAPSA